MKWKFQMWFRTLSLVVLHIYFSITDIWNLKSLILSYNSWFLHLWFLHLTFLLSWECRIDVNCRVLFGENPIPRDPKVNNAARALRPASRLLHVVNDLGDRLRVSYGDSKRLSPLYIVEKIRLLIRRAWTFFRRRRLESWATRVETRWNFFTRVKGVRKCCSW